MTKSKADQKVDERLDEELEDSFPASDPPSMTQPKHKIGAPKGDKASQEHEENKANKK